MKYFLVCVLIASASAFVRRDTSVAKESQDVLAQSLDSIKKDLADLASKLTPDQISEAFTKATAQTTAALNQANENIKAQISKATPEVKKSLEDLQKKVQDALAYAKEAADKQTPDVLDKLTAAFENLTKNTKTAASELQPQVLEIAKNVEQIGKSLLDEAFSALNEFSKKINPPADAKKN